MSFTDPPFVPEIVQDTTISDSTATATITTSTVNDPLALPNIGSMLTPPVGLFLGYGSSVDYSFDMGLRPQPVAAPALSTPVQFVRLHTGICYKTIAAVSLTVGMDPKLPSDNTNSVNDVLLFKKVVNVSPGKLTDGSPVNCTIAVYLYCLQQMPSETDMLDRGRTPIDANTVGTNILNPSSVFDTTLMGPAAPVSDAPSGGINY